MESNGQPANAVMSLADNNNVSIRCNDIGILSLFLHCLNFLRSLIPRESLWGDLFRGSMGGIIPLNRMITGRYSPPFYGRLAMQRDILPSNQLERRSTMLKRPRHLRITF